MVRGAVWHTSFRKKSKGGTEKSKGGLRKVKGGLRKVKGGHTNMFGNHFCIINARMVQSVESVCTVLI